MSAGIRDRHTKDSSTPSTLVDKEQSIELDELKKHNGTDGSYWTSLDGIVYDISEFVNSNSHPGGDIIRLSAGREAGTLFQCYHPSTKLKRVEATLGSRTKRIGVLVGGKPRPDDTFYRVVSERVDKFLADRGINRHHYELLGIGEVIITTMLYFIATYYTSVHGSYLASIFLGVLTARLGFIMHSGNHMAISRWPWGNTIAGYCMELAGSSHVVWYFEHQVAHHMDPNEVGKDNDCSIGAPMLRFHPDLKEKHWITKYQHILTFIGMSSGFFKWYIGDFKNFRTGQVGSVKFHVTRGDWIRLFIFKGWWLFSHVVVCLYFHSVLRTIGLVCTFMGLGAQYLENVFIVNHIQEALAYPPPNAHWAVKQVLATANWASGSPFWNWFSGGLNHQVEHHLFPSISIYNYPMIAPIVQQTCQEFGMPYQNYSSFPTAWLSMARYLRDLGTEGFEVAKRNLERDQPSLSANQPLPSSSSSSRRSPSSPRGKDLKDN